MARPVTRYHIDGMPVDASTFRRWVGWLRMARGRGADVEAPETWRAELQRFADRIGWDIEMARVVRDATDEELEGVAW